MKCQAWWEQNCVYLDPTVRESFVRAYSAASDHHSYVCSRLDADLIEKNWKVITEFHNVFFKAIQLPPLSELEVKALGIMNEPFS